LIADVGFEPIDIGGLKNARYTEPFALLMAEIAYGGKKGPEMAYQFKWFKN
jgi:predicted dinucleotide-binding enzyme